MNIVTLTDYVPIPRFDGTPWSAADIQEALAPDTPDADWTTIQTVNLLPLDSDPEHPQERNFTFPGTEGKWYRVTFKDLSGKQMLPTDPIHNKIDTSAPYKPIVSDVGAILRTRTVDDLGNELGTFNESTKPTADEVDELIEQAASLMLPVLGEVPADLYDMVKSILAFRAAMLVELTYFPEQVAGKTSPYEQLKELFDAQMGLLTEALANRETDDDDSDTAGGMAHFGFPPSTEMVGYRTVM